MASKRGKRDREAGGGDEVRGPGFDGLSFGEDGDGREMGSKSELDVGVISPRLSLWVGVVVRKEGGIGEGEGRGKGVDFEAFGLVVGEDLESESLAGRRKEA